MIFLRKNKLFFHLFNNLLKIKGENRTPVFVICNVFNGYPMYMLRECALHSVAKMLLVSFFVLLQHVVLGI